MRMVFVACMSLDPTKRAHRIGAVALAVDLAQPARVPRINYIHTARRSHRMQRRSRVSAQRRNRSRGGRGRTQLLQYF